MFLRNSASEIEDLFPNDSKAKYDSDGDGIPYIPQQPDNLTDSPRLQTAGKIAEKIAEGRRS